MDNPCRTCGGAAHPATGCVYGPNFIVCRRCTVEAWRWIQTFTAGKGRRRGPSFYEHVNVVDSRVITVEA